MEGDTLRRRAAALALGLTATLAAMKRWARFCVIETADCD